MVHTSIHNLLRNHDHSEASTSQRESVVELHNVSKGNGEEGEDHNNSKRAQRNTPNTKKLVTDDRKPMGTASVASLELWSKCTSTFRSFPNRIASKIDSQCWNRNNAERSDEGGTQKQYRQLSTCLPLGQSTWNLLGLRVFCTPKGKGRRELHFNFFGRANTLTFFPTLMTKKVVRRGERVGGCRSALKSARARHRNTALALSVSILNPSAFARLRLAL